MPMIDIYFLLILLLSFIELFFPIQMTDPVIKKGHTPKNYIRNNAQHTNGLFFRAHCLAAMSCIDLRVITVFFPISWT